MKKIIFLFLTLIFIDAYGQESMHNSKKNTLVEFSDIISSFDDLEKVKGQEIDIHINTATPGYLLLIKNTEEIRKIPPEKLKWLEGLFNSFGIEYKAGDLFENEVFIKTDSGKYWFPIQKSLETFWKEELQIDDLALIYIRAYGSTNDKESDKWLITINSFNSNYYDGLWEVALNSFNENDSFNGLNCINKLIELDPNDGRNFAMLGFYYYDKGFPSNTELLKKANALYTKAIELTPNYSYVYYQKALVKIQLKEYSKAWDNIDIARKLGEVNIEQVKLTELENQLPYAEYLKLKN